MKLRILLVKLFFAIFLIFSFTKILNAQFFVKSYDFPVLPGKTDIGKSIQLDLSPVESWSVAGYSNTTNAGLYDWMFLRLDKNGITKCSALLGFQYDDSCYSHVQLESKNYVLAGFYMFQPQRPIASFSILDTNCNHILSNQIFDTSKSTYTQVIKTPILFGFVLTGFKEVMIPMPQKKVIAGQFTNLGAIVWNFFYMTMPPVSSEEAYSICHQVTDNTYAITGKTNIITGSNLLNNVFVMKLGPNGAPFWMKVYCFPYTGINSESRKIIPMQDGGFVIIGWTDYLDPGFSNIWIFRITSNGNLMWSYTLGVIAKADQGHSIILSSDNTLVFTGYTNLLGTNDVLIGKFPLMPMPPVSPLWTKTFERISTNDFGYDVKEAQIPQGYGVTGRTNPAVSGSLDAFLMRTNMNGFVTPACLDSVIIPVIQNSVVYDSIGFMEVPLQMQTITPLVSHPVPGIRNLCVITKVNENGNLPNEYLLMQNYPNPFNSTTNIQFSIPKSGNVTIKLFDITGREVFTVINENKEKGAYIISFNATEFPSGLYFYKMKSNEFNAIKRMILVK